MKKYNVLQNMLYVYKRQISFKKSFKWRIPFYIFVSILVPILTAIIPSIIVASITLNSKIELFIIVILLVLCFYLAANSILVYLNETLTMDNTFVRAKGSIYDLAKKSLKMDYANLEPYECRQRLNRAEMGVSNNNDGMEGMMKASPAIVINLIGILLYSILLLRVSWVIFVLMITMTIINFLLTIVSSKYHNKIAHEMTDSLAKHNHIVKSVGNEAYAKDARVYHMKPFFIKLTDALLKKISFFYMKQTTIDKLPQFSDTILTIVRDFFAYFILISNIYHETLTIVDFTFYLSIITGLSVWLNGLSMNVSKLYFQNIEVNYFREFLEYPDIFKHQGGEKVDDLLNVPFDIVFDHVSFTYPDSDKKIFSDLSFTIKSKEKIALVGINGAGKTTLVKLLCGLYKPSSGAIFIHGKNIQDFNIEEYYRLISVVFQEDTALEYTIAENVSMRFLEDTDFSLLQDCLIKAGLFEKVNQLPQKEKTFIGKTFQADGIRLSGGETQKLILARALYKNAPLLILDEPTAALDPLAEAELYQKYHYLTQEKTSIFISHRLSSTKFCDRIFFLENGQIKEEGSHEELMKKQGAYKKMFDVQAQYYKEEEKHEEE